ncbi:hypothetical protein U8527_18535 [Kordia algicida OT-1]|uniref:Uncharacterized protein n=1 Tax=Kordia algicida OT-1 TaxID=391587 RepID=A9DIZ1_9FLAO|nr:hypothetical protein [Kordia algicida]EDP97992.1 hypothetical protein KAOT1_12282 [Kordia algicida OT-1]
MKRFLASVVFLLITFSCFSQDLNSYKYVVVPYKFDFLKKHDKYRVNTLIRHLFKQEGFVVLYDNEKFPEELADDRCLGLYTDINNKSTIFTTKMAIVLRDCSNQIVMETNFGRSKIKAYEKGYNQALRSAFEEIKAKNYTYIPKVKEVPATAVKTVEQTQEKAVENVKVTVTKEQTPIKKKVVQTKTTTVTTETSKLVLYAQPIENGYQLVDSTPKVVMILLKTGVPNVYLVKGQDATVYKENGNWILSKATADGNAKSTLQIKF